MAATYKIIKYIMDLGPAVLLPSILFILGLLASKNFLKTLKNSVFIFIGLSSISVLLSIFINFFKPIIGTIIINSSKKFEILDVGWAISEKVILNSPIIFQIIIATIFLNILMLVLRLTRTVNIDLWNYWNFLLAGSIIFTITEMQWIGILISIVIASITLVMSDIYAHYIESYFGLNGVSNPQANVICWAPVSHLITIVLNKIPLIKKIHIFYEEIQYKLGIFSEPMIIGFVLGFIIGIITKYKNFYLNAGPNFLYGLTSGLKLSIIMILLPRAVNILFMGLAPIIDSIRSFISHRVTKRTIYIGLDSIIFVGHPSVIGLSIIIIPLSVYMATLLPGNTLLPNADLVMIPLILIWAIALSGGDIFRSFISAIIIIPIVLFVTADMGNLLTNLFLKYNMELTEGYSQISSIGGSSNLFFWILLQIIKPILNLFL